LANYSAESAGAGCGNTQKNVSHTGGCTVLLKGQQQVFMSGCAYVLHSKLAHISVCFNAPIRYNERSSNRVKKMSDKAKMNRDRVANFRNRKIAAGLKELKIWVKPEHAEQIKSFAKSLGE
jgi:hypothetical protein